MAVVLCAAALISSHTLRAGSFGIVGGASFLGIKDVSSGMTTGYHAGLAYKFNLPAGFAIQPSLLYHMKASSYEAGSVDADLKVGYVELPVSFQWGPDLLLFRPFVDVSPFIGYGVSNDVSLASEAKGGWDFVKRLEYGLGIGGGIEVWELQLVCRYNWNFGPLLNQGIKNNFGGVTLSLAFLF